MEKNKAVVRNACISLWQYTVYIIRCLSFMLWCKRCTKPCVLKGERDRCVSEWIPGWNSWDVWGVNNVQCPWDVRSYTCGTLRGLRRTCLCINVSVWQGIFWDASAEQELWILIHVIGILLTLFTLFHIPFITKNECANLNRLVMYCGLQILCAFLVGFF